MREKQKNFQSQDHTPARLKQLNHEDFDGGDYHHFSTVKSFFFSFLTKPNLALPSMISCASKQSATPFNGSNAKSGLYFIDLI